MSDDRVEMVARAMEEADTRGEGNRLPWQDYEHMARAAVSALSTGNTVLGWRDKVEQIQFLATNHGAWLENDPAKLVSDIHKLATEALEAGQVVETVSDAMCEAGVEYWHEHSDKMLLDDLVTGIYETMRSALGEKSDGQ